MYLDSQNFSPDKCYVVFVDNVSLWWRRFLKKGFRHCYVIFELDNGKCLEINPMSNRMLVVVHGFNYLSYLKNEQKAIIIECVLQPLKPFAAPLSFLTCVGITKRILGFYSRKIITPYQLFKKLKSVGKKS